jgi:thiamine biosynthesis lipoprotein
VLPPPPPLLPTRGGFPLKTLALALVAGAVAAFALANKEKKSEQPAAKGNDEPIIQKVIELNGGAITTSGNYRKFIENGSKKLSHLMDPKPGRPIEYKMISVTVKTRDAMSADGYDNVLIGLGIEKSFDFLKKHKGLEAYFIYRDDHDVVRDTASAGFFK